jgi:hypothetical protein
MIPIYLKSSMKIIASIKLSQSYWMKINNSISTLKIMMPKNMQKLIHFSLIKLDLALHKCLMKGKIQKKKITIKMWNKFKLMSRKKIYKKNFKLIKAWTKHQAIIKAKVQWVIYLQIKNHHWVKSSNKNLKKTQNNHWIEVNSLKLVKEHQA